VVFTTSSSGAAGTSNTFASRTGTFSGNPTAGQTVTVGNTSHGKSIVLTARAGSNVGLDFQIVAGDNTAMATNLANAIRRNGGTVGVTATSAAAVVTVTAITWGSAQNANTTLAEGLSTFSWAGANLAGGAGTAAQPTIFALNQLYSSCGTTTQAVPAVYWSYNMGTAAFAETSPIISIGGDQVAFVQRTGTAASLVLLKWSNTVSVGTLGVPTIPTSATLANYRACAAPCMTVMAFSGNPNDTNSSPFYDYANDIIYVGANNGTLHKFTNVFNGTPAEVVSSGANVWPAVVSSTALTSPVYDSVTSRIFVGSTRSGSAAGTGALHAVDKTIGSGAGGITTSGVLFVNNMTGTFDTPIVDSTTGKVYVFVGDDSNNSGNSAIYQFAAGTSLAPASQTPSKAVLGSGATTTTIYSGSFDDTYYSGAGNTGYLYVCGAHNSGVNPRLFRVDMSTVPFGTTVVRGHDPTTNNTTAECSPITEVKNGADDLIFFSVSANGSDTGCTGACVYMYNLTGIVWSPAAVGTAGLGAPGGAGGIIIDNVSATTGASQIYFSTLTSPGNAVQASQAGLN
jgi:hypothetical protein